MVIDSNVLLDWLVFHDPAGLAVGHAVQTEAVRWIATPAMHQELQHVLMRGLLPTRWTCDVAAVLGTFELHGHERPAARLAGTPVCSDPDDQKFIDLAVSAGARWLLTRDRALLRLARRARAFGVDVLQPAIWLQRRDAAVTPR